MHKRGGKSLGGIARLCILSSVLVLGSGTVVAQVNVTASISNLRYTVADLDAGDGVEATLLLGDWYGLPSATGDIYGWHNGAIDFDDGKYQSSNVNADSASLAWAPMSSFTSSFSGREAVSTIRGDVAITSAPAIAGQNVSTRANVSPADLYFRLSPMSSMTVQVDAALYLSAGYVPDFKQHGGGGVSLTVGPAWWPGDYDAISDGLNGDVGDYYGTIYPGEVDLARTLTLTLVNGSATEWKNGNISLGAGGVANITSPVPEPQAWQLLAAGLVLLPAWARRSKRGRTARS